VLDQHGLQLLLCNGNCETHLSINSCMCTCMALVWTMQTHSLARVHLPLDTWW
jgi:hypothetical protein